MVVFYVLSIHKEIIMENNFGEIMNAIGEENNFLKMNNKNLEIQKKEEELKERISNKSKGIEKEDRRL